MSSKPARGIREPNTPAHPTLRYFEFGHLPENLRRVSEPCAALAIAMAERLPEGAELSAGLRKLLEAKDCFVRAAIDGARET